MRRWQLTGLVVVAAVLFFTARPAQAQVWFGPPVGPPPVWVGPSAPVVVAPGTVVVNPGWVSSGWASPGWVSPGWEVGPAWGVQRVYRPVRRAGWYGAVRGPRGGVVAFGRRW